VLVFGVALLALPAWSSPWSDLQKAYDEGRISWWQYGLGIVGIGAILYIRYLDSGYARRNKVSQDVADSVSKPSTKGPTSGFAIASMVFGLLSFICCFGGFVANSDSKETRALGVFCAGVAAATGILTIVFFFMARKACSQGKSGFWIGGVGVLYGSVGTAISLLVICAVIAKSKP
jgi:hypothetical protein